MDKARSFTPGTWP